MQDGEKLFFEEGDIVLIIISLAMALILTLAIKGCVLFINAKLGGNIRGEHLHLFVVLTVIFITMYYAPKLMVSLGYLP
jgi:hypothetical protein